MAQPQLVSLTPNSDVAAAPAVAPAAAPAPAAASRRVAPVAPPPRSAFVPVLLCALTLLVWFGFQIVLSFADREALLASRMAQQQAVDNAARLRTSLDALAADTRRLADGGNASAALLVTELGKRGVTIAAPPGASAAEAASAPTAPR